MGDLKWYLVLGCGDVGFVVASELKKREEIPPVVIDKDERKVEHLKKLGYMGIAGDFGSPEVLRKAKFESVEAVLITVADLFEVKRALAAINHVKAETGVSPRVVARVHDEAEAPEVSKLGATEVVSAVQAIAGAMLGREKELGDILGKLRAIDEVRNLIYMHPMFRRKDE